MKFTINIIIAQSSPDWLTLSTNSTPKEDEGLKLTSCVSYIPVTLNSISYCPH